MPLSPFSTSVERGILRFFEDVSTPRSLTAAMLLKYREWDQLASLKVDPLQYSDSHAYWLDASVSSLLKKCQDLPTTFDRKAVAIENFELGERDCFRTNQRLYPYIDDLRGCPTRGAEIGGLHEIISTARKIIADILGPCPDGPRERKFFEVPTEGGRRKEFFTSEGFGRFGPGATYGDRGKLTTVPDKMSSSPTFSSGAWPWLFQWSGTAWASACAAHQRSPVSVRGNRFTTVPKDCRKDRGIAVEPSINLFYQLEYGKILKKRLHAAGINLRDGQDIHRRLACEASIKGHLATIDLKNASDSISSRLVELLLPSRWYECLSSLRSPTTLIGGRVRHLEKFSSMGNGYTFELETLLFLAICLAVDPAHKAGENVFVYGDDIIVPTESSNVVIRALNFFGMTVNVDKTFTTGYFRESCGGDYFKGSAVRPHHIESAPNEPQHLYALANGIYRMGLCDPHALERHSVLRRFRLVVIDGLPRNLRYNFGPSGLGDIVLHSDDYSCWSTRWRSSIRYIRCYRPAVFIRIPWKYWLPDVVLATILFGIGDERGGRDRQGQIRPELGVTPRDAVAGFKVGWVPFS